MMGLHRPRTFLPYTTRFRSGLEDVGAGLHVRVMHLADQARLRQVEFIEAAVEKDALGVEQRAHGAVTHQHTFGEGVEKSATRSEEHTSELQSPCNIVRRLQHDGAA